MPLVDVIRFVTDLVQDTGLDYVTIGGIAVSAQAEPRSTKDVDLVIVLPAEQVNNLLSEIERRGLVISRKSQVREKLMQGRPAKVIWDKRFSFDLRLANYTIDMQALVRARPVELKKYGVTLKIASPEDLVVYKLALFDETDRKDIKQIIKFTPGLDWDYIRLQARILTREYEKPSILEHLTEAETWEK
mgnify:CR=1 FL=1